MRIFPFYGGKHKNDITNFPIGFREGKTAAFDDAYAQNLY